jgi:predicted DNA-binding transcriptional regulator AlpA
MANGKTIASGVATTLHERTLDGLGVDVAALLADPASATNVPVQAIPALLTEVAAQEANLATVRSILAARLAVSADGTMRTTPQSDDLIDAPEAARRISMSVGWLYKNAKRLPFSRRIGPRTVRFSADGIRHYLALRGQLL